MCSRQERIQKDIDVVIQKSRAEKDCLFAGEFLPLGSWDLEPVSHLTTPVPRFQTETRVAGGVGRQVPVPGAFGNSCRHELEPQGERGTSLLPPPKKKPTHQARAVSGCRTRAIRAEGPGAGFQPSAVAGASELCLPIPAAAAERSRLEPGGFAPSAERRRPGRDRLRCAARRCSRQAPRPREKAAQGRAPAPSAAPAPGRACRTPPRGRDGFPGFLSYAGPAWGSLCVHLYPPTSKAEGSLGFAARSLAGAASGCLAGKFPLLPWHPALVAGGGLPLHPAGCSASPSAPPCWPTLVFQPLLPSPSGLPGSHEIAGSRQNWG